MNKDYWKALFASPQCGNFIFAIPCCLVVLITWPLDGWLYGLGVTFCFPTIYFGHRAWKDTKTYVYPHETFRPELPQPWLLGILVIGYLRGLCAVLKLFWWEASTFLKSWAVTEHQYPGATVGVIFGFVILFLAREVFCWFFKTNRILEQQALQLKELRELKEKVEQQSKVISDIRSDTSSLRQAQH